MSNGNGNYSSLPPGYATTPSYYGPSAAQRAAYAPANPVYAVPMPSPANSGLYGRPPPPRMNPMMNMNMNRNMAPPPRMQMHRPMSMQMPPAPRGGLLPRPQMGAPPPRPSQLSPMYGTTNMRPMMPNAPGNSNQWQWSSGENRPTNVAATPAPVQFQFNGRGPAAGVSRAPVNCAFQAQPQPVKAPTPAPTSSNSAGSTASVMNSTKWPPALQDYVKRAFARCKGKADQALTQNALKEMITNAIMASTLWTKNWTVEPLPTLVGDVRPNMAPTVSSAPVNPYARPPPPKPSSMMSHMNSTEQFIPFTYNKTGKRKPETSPSMSSEELKRKNQRRQRFLKEQREAGVHIVPTVDPKSLRVLNSVGELDFDAMTIKGTCQTIEKKYLRLTSAPHPSTVRPQHILEKALEMVKQKWKKRKCDYIYACSQLKSIRQDCTVQRIKNAFTVTVYETHARVALESGDINEFNQCQTQLHELYEKAIPGQAIEFLSYRILYCIYVSLQAKKAESNAGQLGMYSVLSCVTSSLRQHPAVAHALAVREAVAVNNYHGFFKLYDNAPNMSAFLMDCMLPTVRLRALRTICKAFRPHISIAYVRQELHLDDRNDGGKFVAQSGIVFVKGSSNALVDTKNSDIVWVLRDESSLI